MRYIGLVVLISCGLAACQSHQSVEQQPAKVISTLDPIDFKKEDSLVHEKLEQYKVASFSTGSWVNQKPGQYLKLQLCIFIDQTVVGIDKKLFQTIFF